MIGKRSSVPGIGHLGIGEAIAAAAIVAATALLCGLATRALIPILRRRDLLDRPNERSSHTVPIPRGGGIALVGTVLLAWLALYAAGRVSLAIPIVALGAVLLATICWIDDLRGLSPATRLAAQAAAVALGLSALPEGGNAFEGSL